MKMIIPGLIAVELAIISASKSTPPGLIWNRSMIPTPIPITIPPRIALDITGRCINPFRGAKRSIAVVVNAKPRMAFIN
jgi:hypothetical protein